MDEWQSVREALLSFKFQGWLKQLEIKPGQFVQEGDLLAQLDPPRSGGLSLEQAVTDAQYTLQNQSIALEAARTKDVAVVSLAAKARVNQAKISVQQAQAAYDKIAWRGDVGSSPEAMALSRAVADYEAAQAALEAEMEAEETYSKTREVEIKGLEASVAQARELVERAKARVLETQLKAPFAGLLLSVDKRIGDPVEPYEAIGTLR